MRVNFRNFDTVLLHKEWMSGMSILLNHQLKVNSTVSTNLSLFQVHIAIQSEVLNRQWRHGDRHIWSH